MPVSELFVEGPERELAEEELERRDDIELPILHRVFAGRPKVTPGGSKGSLRPKAFESRAKGIVACYLRDRDFDADPPQDTSRPVEHSRYQNRTDGPVLGWTWCRHEIESYLVDSRVISAVTGVSEEEMAAALVRAGLAIRDYTAARWTLGAIRRGLPVVGELRTRPGSLKGAIRVPADCSRTACAKWVSETAASFLSRTTVVLEDAGVSAIYRRYVERLAALTTAEEVLLWHSGKDLLAALDPALYRGVATDPYSLRRMLRNWIRAHAEEAVQMFPEWERLRAQLRQP